MESLRQSLQLCAIHENREERTRTALMETQNNNKRQQQRIPNPTPTGAIRDDATTLRIRRRRISWRRRKRDLPLIFVALALLLNLSLTIKRVRGGSGITCQQDSDCQEALDIPLEAAVCQFSDDEDEDSYPRTGVCQNPFYYQPGGCLSNDNLFQAPKPYMSGDIWEQRRCTSEDEPFHSQELGYCRGPEDVDESVGGVGVEYQEVRIYAQNWESVFFEAWMLQILLTEVLGVPTTIETGVPGLSLDFYHPTLEFGYGTGNNYSGFENAKKYHGNCGEANRADDEHIYEPCYHFVPEVWATQINRLLEIEEEGLIGVPEGLGVVGAMNWYIPRFTAERDPSLLTYFGLAENRTKMAELFLRPTNWGTYCAEVSPNKCNESDSVAQRAPADADEAGLYHHESLYTGYFRKTDENDCENYPDTCTGHIADFPCGWSSYVEQQTWHLDIALRSSGTEKGCRGYTYGQLLGIFAAAHATKSDIIFQWWEPDALHNSYSGTHSEFQSVGMPRPSSTCIETTVTSVERCSENQTVRIGSPEGACGEPPYSLQKVYSSTLPDITRGPSIPFALHNPAYNLFKAFRFSGLELLDLYDKWLNRSKETSFDLRYATCEWMREHWDQMERFLPESYPRVVEENNPWFEDTLFLVVFIFAMLATASVVVTAILTEIKREEPAIVYAQVGFLRILLAGLLLVAIGTIVSLLPTSDGTCASIPWLINLGYTLQIVPLIVKVAAIQKLLAAAKKLRRVKLDMNYLYLVVSGISLVLLIYLAIWTGVDAPKKHYNYDLTSKTKESGALIVSKTPYCQSDSEVWLYIAAVWHGLLLLAAAVLSFQTRKLKTDFHETEILALMIYSQFVFVALRIITYALAGDGNEADVTLYRSLIYSLDILTSIGIYFVPKFLLKEEHKGVIDLRTANVNYEDGMSGEFQRLAAIAGFPQNSSSKSGLSKSAVVRHNSKPGSSREIDIPPIAEASNEQGSSAHHSQRQESSTKLLLVGEGSLGLRCRHCGRDPSVSNETKTEETAVEEDGLLKVNEGDGSEEGE